MTSKTRSVYGQWSIPTPLGIGTEFVILSGRPRLGFFTCGTDEVDGSGAVDAAGNSEVDSPAGTGWELLTGFFLFLGFVGRFGT